MYATSQVVFAHQGTSILQEVLGSSNSKGVKQWERQRKPTVCVCVCVSKQVTHVLHTVSIRLQPVPPYLSLIPFSTPLFICWHTRPP